MSDAAILKTANPLPKNAAVCPQWVKCGRRPCKCDRDSLHGPYWYLFWRERGRLRKQYLRAADGERMRLELARRRRMRRTLTQTVAHSEAGLRQATEDVREVERLWK